MLSYKTYLAVFLLAMGLAWFVTPLVIRLAGRWGALDKPGNRKIHRRTVPLLGGLAIATGMWLPLVGVLYYNNSVATALGQRSGAVLAVLVGGLFMLVLGMVDDFKGLNARQKFSVQVPVACLLVALGIKFTSVTLPGWGTVQLGHGAYLISLLWVLGVTNAVNIIDGMDGLATGVALVAAATSAVVAIYYGNVVEAVMMCALAGACLGFLRYNFNPARIFLGDTGSLFLGVTLATSAMASTYKGVVGASLLLPVVILGYPIADTLLSITRRVYRGKSPFSGDASHIHHRLLAVGLTHRQAALAIYAVCVLCGVVAVAALVQNGMVMAAGLLAGLVVALRGLHVLGYLNVFLDKEVPHDRLVFQSMYAFAAMMEAKIKLAANQRQLVEYVTEICREFGKAAFQMKMPGRHVQYGMSWADRGLPAGVPPPGQGAMGSFSEIVHEFPDTGICIAFYFIKAGEQDEFRIEKRNLLAKLAGAVSERYKELQRQHPQDVSLNASFANHSFGKFKSWPSELADPQRNQPTAF